ncbi:protein FAR1-RELATED SEQUENCE 7-like [Silene latifolia]|uniref:protein FAR1-RELATED SEQUENCE 7-like n=1 Tax=Silene latifolia TaxID=37657 RepID=UPI003D788BD1
MTVNRLGFFFDYDVDSDGSLSKAIWANDIARRNYSVFGDAVSFDPTYSTNKYDMDFTPFTGVDHHKRSVTFCGALVAHEDADSFQWVFSRFLAVMSGKEPKYIITDQDPGILKAVPIVFKTARHRYCMWHIMNKVPSKFGVTREDYSEFVKKPNAIIWDEDIKATEFDAKWDEIGREHTVNNIDWFKEMGFSEASSLEVTTVRDANRDRNYQVTYCQDTFKATCSCRMLERKGIICRHVIWIYSSNGVKKIPELCVVNRWCKDGICTNMFDCNGEAAEDVDIIDGKQIAMSVMWSEIHQIVAMLMGKLKADVDNFSSVIREFKEKLSPYGSPMNKQQ